MKTIRIKFVDMWEDFDPKENVLMKMLREKYDIEFSDIPDYIFYSVFGSEHMKYDCIRIFWTGESQFPDFNICDYAIGFDYFELGDRYVRLPLYWNYLGEEIDRLEERRREAFSAKKEKFCNFVYSNANANEYRTKLYEAISRYRRVDSGGRYKNNIGGPVVDKITFMREYKFSIACENSSYMGYTTEKIFQAFAAGTIPIYWGNPLIGREFNRNSFINCHDYESLDDIVSVIKEIDEDSDLYEAYIREPIFTEECLNTMRVVQDFLEGIFDQDIKCATRRNKSFRGMMYERQRLCEAGLYEKVYNSAIIRILKKLNGYQKEKVKNFLIEILSK